MDKIDKLLDAIEHPDRYSDAEMETMLADPEVRDVYVMLDKTKSSLTPIPKPDVDAEWESFRSVHDNTHIIGKSHILNMFSRNVAASIAIGIASLAAVAAVVGVSVNYVLDRKADAQATEPVAEAKEIIASEDSTVVIEGIPAIAPQTITFDNEPLEIIINRMAEYYGYKAEFSTDTSKALRLYFRWDQAQTFEEVVENLNNFEQINIFVKDKTIKID